MEDMAVTPETMLARRWRRTLGLIDTVVIGHSYQPRLARALRDQHLD
jgi:hypothetical protein